MKYVACIPYDGIVLAKSIEIA